MITIGCTSARVASLWYGLGIYVHPGLMEMVFGNATGVPLNVKLAGDVRDTAYIESAGGAAYSNHIVITYSSYIESAGGAGVWWRVGGGGTARNGCGGVWVCRLPRG